MEKNMSLTALNMDRLIDVFDYGGYLNPSYPSENIQKAIAPLFETLKDLAPAKINNEAKSIWLKIPRGDVPEFDSFEQLKEYGEVETYDEYIREYEEYVKEWKEEYPDEYSWYELVISEEYKKDGSLWYRSVMVGNTLIVNAAYDMKQNDDFSFPVYKEEYVEELCRLANEAAKESMDRLRNGTYNKDVEDHLPYWFKTGVVKRCDIVEEYDEPDMLEEIDADVLKRFKELLKAGENDIQKIERMDSMTANDFFKACSIGYHACGYDKIFDDDGKERPLSEQYIRIGDGRDEGLTGTGFGLNEGEGIDFDDPKAWDEWYFNRKQSGGHPWEVVAGGNSTHIDLYVCHDKTRLRWKVRLGELSQEEYDKARKGYYFSLAGLHRGNEVVTFYIALHEAGYPVVIDDADELLARFEKTDYVGIVPRHMMTRYNSSLIPEKYGHVVDFMHVYDEDLRLYGDKIEWLPEDEAVLTVNEESS